MRPIPIAQYLNQIPRERAGAPQTPGEAPRVRLVAAVSPAQDPEETSRVAYERGLREGEDREREASARRYAMQAAEQEARFAQERERIVASAYDDIAEGLSASLDEIEARIAAVTARILQPLVIKDHERRIEAALAECLKQMFSAEGPAVLRIRGPKAALEALAARLCDRPVEIIFEERDGLDISIAADCTLIEAQLDAFASSVATAIA